MNFAPIARIFVRYIVGTVAGASAADAVLADPDAMHIVTIGIAAVAGVVTEWAYKEARKRGWAT